MITYLGEVSLSAAVPLLATFKSALAATTSYALPELQAQLTGLGNVLVAITVAPPALGATITAAIATVAQLQLAIGGPTVTLQIGAITAKLALLVAQLGTLTAAAALDIPSGSVHAYVYSGALMSFGAELQAEVDLTIGGGTAQALVFVATSPADWAACGEVFIT